MKKISIIYWSCGGNIESLSNIIAKYLQESGNLATVKHVADASLEDVIEADAIIFASPSIDEYNIEQYEMEPFINKLANIEVNHKKVFILGSVGWKNDKCIDNWVSKMEKYNFDVVGSFVIRDSLTKEDIEKVKSLVSLLTK